MQSDRYGDIADITRGPAGRDPRGHARRPSGPPRSRRARACARWCSGARGGWGSSRRPRSTCSGCPRSALDPRLPVPELERAGVAAMRDIAASDAAPSVTRVSDALRDSASPSPPAREPVFLDGPEVPRRSRPYLRRRLALRRGGDVPPPSSATRAPPGTSPPSAGRSAGSSSRHGGLCVGSGPGVLYDQKKFDTPYIRDFLLDRGIPRGRLGDRGAMGRAARGLRQRRGRRPRRLRRPGRPRLRDVPPVALLPRRGVPLLHVRVRAHEPEAASSRTTTEVKSAVQQTFVDSRRGPCRTTMRSARSTRPWLEQDVSAPGVAMLRALFDGVDPGRNLNPGKIVSPSQPPAGRHEAGRSRRSEPR